MNDAPINAALNNRGRSVLDLDTYKEDQFVLEDYAITFVLDNVILAEYIDITTDGTNILRRGIVVPLAHVQKCWRIAKVLICGPECKYIKPGDHICIPNDKGIPASQLAIECDQFTGIIKNAIFLSEDRVFGRLKKKPQQNENSNTA